MSPEIPDTYSVPDTVDCDTRHSSHKKPVHLPHTPTAVKRMVHHAASARKRSYLPPRLSD